MDGCARFTLEQLVRDASRVRRDIAWNNKRRARNMFVARVGQRVRWKHKLREGKIVEIVPSGAYPRKRWPGLVVHGFYRETLSYVVLADNGKAYWPWTAAIEKCPVLESVDR